MTSTVASEGIVSLVHTAPLKLSTENPVVIQKESDFISCASSSKGLDQGDFSSMLTVPLHFVHVGDGLNSSLQFSSDGSNFQEVRGSVREANVLPSNISGQLLLQTNHDGTRSLVIDSADFGEDNVINVDPKLIDNSSGNQSQLQNERGVILQLDDVNLDELPVNNNLISSNVIFSPSGYHYISSKDFDLENNEVFLKYSSPPHPLADQTAPEQLLFNRLVKDDSDTEDINHKLPETQTITITDDQHRDDGESNLAKSNGWVCEKCSLCFASLAAFIKHRNKHLAEKPFCCQRCHESFNYEKNLNLHMALHEPGELKCPECSKVFRRGASFKAHLSVHLEDENVTCDVCSEEFFSVAQLEIHKGLHIKSEKGAPEAVKERLNDDLKPKCKKCDLVFSSNVLLANHMAVHKSIKKLNPKAKKKFGTLCASLERKCELCGKIFAKPSQLARHQRIHTGEKPFKCSHPGCGRAFNQKGSLQIHANIHFGNKAYECEVCGKCFIQKSNLRGHVQRVHPLNKSNERQFYCPECPCVFKKANSLNAHTSRAHLLDTILESGGIMNENVVKEDSAFIGEQQSSITKSAEGDILQQALKNSGLSQVKMSQDKKEELNTSSTEKKTHKIKLVTVIDRLQGEQTRHCSMLVRIQDETKRYLCDFRDCSKEFKKPSDLVRHLRVHTHEKPFKCPKCNRAFSIKASLNGHMKTHMSFKQFGCEQCGKRFFTASSLKSHSWVHTDNKPYRCFLCPKQFRTPSHRKAHILSHKQSAHRLHILKRKNMTLPDVPLQEPILLTSSGQLSSKNPWSKSVSDAKQRDVRRYKCRFCPAAFKKSSHSKQHERTHTGEKPFECGTCSKSFSSHSVLKSHILMHLGVRPFSCQICLKVFSSSGSLKRHLSTHSSDRPYMCPYCHAKFKTNTNCKKHMKIHRHELALNSLNSSSSAGGTSNQPPNYSSSFTEITNSSANVNKLNNNTKGDLNTNIIVSELVDSKLQTKVNIKETDFSICPMSSSSLKRQQGSMSISVSSCDEQEGLAPPTLSLKGIVTQPGIIVESPDYCQVIASTEDKTSSDIELSSSTSDKRSSLLTLNLNTSSGIRSNCTESVDFSSQFDTSSKFVINKLLNSTPSNYPDTKVVKVCHLRSSNFTPVLKEDNILRSNIKDSVVGERGSSDGKKLPSVASNSLTNATVIQDKQNEFLSVLTDHPRKGNEFENVESQEYITKNTTQYEGSSRMANKSNVAVGSLPEIFLFNSDVEANFKVGEEVNRYSHSRAPFRIMSSDVISKDEHCIKVQQRSNQLVSDFRNHSRISIPQTQPKSRKFECNICRKNFHRHHHLKLHMKTHKLYHSCNHCGKTFNTSLQLRDHVRDHHKKQFITSHSLSKNPPVSSQFNLPKSMETVSDRHTWQCPVCRIVFLTSEGIQKHITVHSQQEISVALRKDKAQNTTTENESNPKGREPTKSTAHEAEQFLQDSSESNITTEIDSKGSTKVFLLEKNGLPHVCFSCGKGFKKPSDLVRHIRVHTGEKPFCCKVCSKRFAVKSTLDVHMRTHEGKKEHKCVMCNTYYASKGSLKIHMRIHTGQKPLVCPYCGMKFRTSGHRKAHVANHFRVRQGLEWQKENADVSKKDTSVALSFSEEAEGVASLVSSVDSNVNDGINSVLINPDGTVTLQLSGVGLSEFDESGLFNLQSVDLDDAALDPLYYCSSLSLELPSSTSETNDGDLAISEELRIVDHGSEFIENHNPNQDGVTEKQYEIVEIDELVDRESNIKSESRSSPISSTTVAGVFGQSL